LNRPRQHVLESISDRKLRNLIPDEWVIRKLESDYGIDYMVEIFEGGFSTGNMFFIQLKGTDKNQEKKDEVKYQVKIKHLNYYNTIPNPILFMIYSTKADSFWGIWSNNIKDILTEEQLSQDSVSVVLTKKNIINNLYFKNLTNNFTLNLPKGVSIQYISNSLPHEMCLKHLKNWIHKYFKDNLAVDSLPSPHNITIKFISNENGEFIKVEYLSKEFFSNKIEAIDTMKFQLPVTIFEEVPVEFKEILIHIGLILMKWNVKSSLKLIALCLNDYKGKSLITENIYSLFERAKNEGCILDFQNFIKATLKNGRWDIFGRAQLGLLLQSDYEDFYSENLKLAIELSDDKNQVGMFCYNLANSLMVRNLLYEANLYYHKARKLAPMYTGLHYWWIEYGHVLFSSGHYKFAENFYRRGAKEMNIRDVIPHINGHIGNALFFQGKFKEAEIELQKYIEINPIEDVFHIRDKACRFLKDIFPHSKNNHNIPKNILSNPLSGLHWFNYGVGLLDKKQQEQAFDAFLVVIAIQENDREAWRNCFIIALNLKRDYNAIAILKAALTKFGKSFINDIAETMLENKEVPTENKRKAVNELVRMANMIVEELKLKW